MLDALLMLDAEHSYSFTKKKKTKSGESFPQAVSSSPLTGGTGA